MQVLSWFATQFLSMISRRNVAELIDEQAITLTEQYERELAYQSARLLQRKAHCERDLRTALFLNMVAVRVADITGRHIGPIERDSSASRYGRARRRINGRRTESI